MPLPIFSGSLVTDLQQFIGHWGYLAIFVVVVLGNVGLPVPEETVLALAGYLVWRGQLRLSVVLAVGIMSAVAGDNLGYWIGRRFGRDALTRYALWILGSPKRVMAVERFVTRRGSFAVFVARFFPGIRFLAGPLAGALGLRFLPFFVANVLGAAIYVPVVVGAGYAVGYGFGDYVEQLRRVVGEVERIVLIVVVLGGLALIGWRVARALHQRGRA